MSNSSQTVCTYPTATLFLAKMRALLAADEARHGLMLGLALRVENDPHAYGIGDPYFATVEDAAGIVVAALMTPPRGLILYCARVLTEEGVTPALQRLAEQLFRADRSLPAVNGPHALATQFAALWSRLTGATPVLGMETRVFALRIVRHPPYSPGALRPATTADQDLAVQWFQAFTREALPAEEEEEDQLRQSVGQKIADGQLFFWVDSQPVSLVGVARPTARGISIGPVYTPPAYRGRGYASSAVARVSQQLLDGGKEFCVLFTDLANPTSNHIYQAIGYQPLEDYAVYRFIAAK